MTHRYGPVRLAALVGSLLALSAAPVVHGVGTPPTAGKRSLILIESPVPGAENALLSADVAVLREFKGGWLVVASEDDIGAIDRMDLRYKILDADVTDKTYYTAFMRDETRSRFAASHAVVLAREGLEAVLRASPREADTLAAQGIELARVFMTPMHPQRRAMPILPPSPFEADPLIQGMVDSVSIVRVDSTVQRLQNFVTRYSMHDSCRAAGEWIAAEFESFGIDSVYFHQWDPEYSPNIAAVLPGAAHPERIVVIGGHYDSITADSEHAPGADDNASGAACVLECARILSQHEFDCTIVFVAFSGEEQGLLGSEAYAAEAAARGEDIVGMIAVDMIGYVAPGDEIDLDIIDNPYSAWMRDRVTQVGALYVPGFPIVHGTLTGGSSDHASFWRNGYDAIMFFEDSGNYSPYIHTTNDVVGKSYVNETLAEGSVKVAAAFIADLATPFRVAIAHTPLSHTEDETGPYRVTARIFSARPLNPSSLHVMYTTGAGSNALNLLPTGMPDEYEAEIPGQPAGTVVDYYVVAQDIDGVRVSDPKDAPAETHTFAVGTLSVVFEDDFETNRGWTPGAPDDDATLGIWERTDPTATYLLTTMVQPEDDHTPDPGVACFVTGNSPPGPSQAANDVDDGRTTLSSPVIDLSGCTNAWLSYYRWYTNDTGAAPASDTWVVDVSSDSGATWYRLETTSLSERSWVRVEYNLLRHIPLTAGVRFRFIASDEEPGSIVEAALDDFAIVTYGSATTAIRDDGAPSALQLRLEQNFPNPFNPETTIRFAVPAPGGTVRLTVYDVAGRVIATLLEGERVVGTRTVRWDGRDDGGNRVASGVYFYRLETTDRSISRKLIVLR